MENQVSNGSRHRYSYHLTYGSKSTQTKIICWFYISSVSTSGTYWRSRHLVQLKVKAQLIQISAVKTYQKGKICGSKQWSFCKNSCRVLDREVSLKGALWMVSFLQTISSVYPYHRITTAITISGYFWFRGPALLFTAVPAKSGAVPDSKFLIVKEV